MSRARQREPLASIAIFEKEDMIEPAREPLMKLDFSASARKKGKTPKKRGVFTPMKVQQDIKPKLEPESPTPTQIEAVLRPRLATKKSGSMLQPKIEQVDDGGPGPAISTHLGDHMDDIDVKPDLRALEGLLSGLELGTRDVPPSPTRQPQDFVSPNPLFFSCDSPARSASPKSIKLSPRSPNSPISASLHHQRGTTARQSLPRSAASKLDPFNLFSSDSPPPPVRRPSGSPSISSPGSPSQRDILDDEWASSPSAGPSRIRGTPSPSNSERPALESDSDDSSSAQDGGQNTRNSGSKSVSPSHPRDANHAVLTDNPQNIQTPARQRRRAFLDFLDTAAKADEVSEDEYDYDLDNESEGSLRDFVVDDDQIEYLSDSSGSEKNMHSEAEDSDIVEVKLDQSVDLSGDDSDVIIEEAVSHPKTGKAAGLAFLDEFDDSDQDAEEAENALLDAINDLTVSGPSTTKKEKRKGTKQKSVKAPKWTVERVRIAQEVFDDLDTRVFEGRLGPDGAGAKIVWNKRLLTTAGTAQRKRRRTPDGENSWEVAIQLSEKVCTGEEQILSTVAHEMCHLACWVISHEFKNPHGKIFQSWGRKVMRKRDDLEVTTKHDYIIEYKYQWRCLDCKKVYKRHSKSIDIETQGCGICKGKLEPLFETKSRGTSSFQVYLKQNMSLAKACLPGSSHGEVMRALSARWTEAGPDADHEAHWKAVLAAARK